jgi:Zn-dependent peptidase ImmA (M78 family)
MSHEHHDPEDLRRRADATPPDADAEAAAETAPLPDDWDEQAASLAQSFIAPLEHAREERTLLTDFAHLCLRFAHMEERLQGSLLCELPAHLTVIRGEHPDRLAAEAEHLARVERGNLEVPEGPIEDLADLLDTRGIKVIECTRAPMRRAGAFLFDPRTGPALLCQCPVDTPAGRAVLAHEYCHLLTDVDPYENRFCPPAGAAATGVAPTPGDSAADLAFDDLDVAELRAELFARAFLLPADHFRRTLEMFGVHPGADLSLPRLADVAYYYGVESSLALRRLADLGRIPASARGAMLGLPPGNGTDTWVLEPGPNGTPHPGLFPVPATRFVNLSLALFIRRRISLEQMAYLLGIEPAAAQRFVAWSEAPPEPSEKAR